jgi:putative transposase
MPRQQLVRTSEYPYHVTSRANNKEWFYIPLGDVWRYMEEHLESGKVEYKVELYAAVLMSNHYHLLLSTPNCNIDQFMRFFNQALGKSISKQAGRINRIFGAPYKWNLIRRESYYYNVLRYISLKMILMRICLSKKEMRC